MGVLYFFFDFGEGAAVAESATASWQYAIFTGNKGHSIFADNLPHVVFSGNKGHVTTNDQP